MSLRLQVSLLVSVVTGLFVVAVIGLQTGMTRLSVHEEIETARRIANRVVQRIVNLHGRNGTGQITAFFDGMGRLRAIDIVVLNDTGEPVYTSPPSTYKPGQFAPRWYTRLVAPPPRVSEFRITGGLVKVQTEPSRATRDAWDQARQTLLVLAASVLLLGAFVYLLIGHAMRPFRQIMAGLQRVESGDYSFRLPQLPITEANAIGQAFNQMSGAIHDNLAAREHSARTEEKLAHSQELNRQIDEQTEQFSLSLARELHDELGQHVTAIKSLAMSIEQRSGPSEADEADPETGQPNNATAVRQAAQLISESADRVHQVMRSMLKRLTPVSLDQFGLADALRDLVTDLQMHHPDIQFELDVDASVAQPEKHIARTAYRIAQECLTNAIRHAHATRIAIKVERSTRAIVIRVADDGVGLGTLETATGLGLRGILARAQALNGDADFERGTLGGLAVTATLPLNNAAIGPTDNNEQPTNE